MIKVTGPTGPREADKTKKARKPGASGGTFASMLAAAEEADNTPSQTASTPYHAGMSLPQGGRPTTPQELLETLEDLTADVLLQNPTNQAEKLQGLLDNLPDQTDKTPEQQQVMNELATTAAATLAKLKQK